MCGLLRTKCEVLKRLALQAYKDSAKHVLVFTGLAKLALAGSHQGFLKTARTLQQAGQTSTLCEANFQ